MSLPELLSGAAGDEEVVARVPLGGDDLLAVTPTRTLVYRADGLLSDETVEEYPHDAERIAVSTGRRKSKVVFGYGLDGEETLTVPSKRLDDVVHPVLAGVLSARGVTDPGESVARTFRFSELTLVVTDSRLVKHVGSAVWDEEFEEFPYADLTDLDFEEGTVATAVVLAHDGRSERFKAPNESARAVKESLVDAVCAFHGVESLEELRVAVANDADDDAAADDAPEGTTGTTDFGEGPDPLSASPAADAEAATEMESPFETDPDPDPAAVSEPTAETEADGSTEAGVSTGTDFDRGGTGSAGRHDEADGTIESAGATDVTDAGSAVGNDPLADEFGGDSADANGTGPDGTGNAAASSTPADSGDPAGPDGFEGSPFESAGVEDDDLAAEVAALRRTVEAQSAKIERQSELIERLIEELRQGR
ncbi:hypothetical protein SAMN04488066_10268 [Halorubrum aquaticum]|uniref:DUF7115 domain-containing protein n=1 Tax=Halorubrum aquaticum TaxID=387340 RepID=A0A1I2ZG80_9EURY|nr:hypothetical protein [Halorubrum aquaticum]SFH36837.1 hypothetical protein SAMN04488066_10268 [Halorubrum aquaticum]